mmetsp:Transcript_17680/g.48903  ORF Transcript_17680/g.48903 Transcript_17680/m.48903 type:complete len:86 (+) Transcript_17680:3256-3513(+)
MICKKQRRRSSSQGDPSCPSFVATVTTLDCKESVLSDEILLSSLQPSYPALNHGCTCTLMEYTVGLKSIVRGLSHEHLSFSQLDI